MSAPTDPDTPVTRDEFDRLRATVAELTDLVARLDHDLPASDGAPDPAAGQAGFWALEGLRARVDDPAGAVLLTGTVELEPGVPHAWQQGATTTSLLETAWEDLAPALDALGHPVRLQLLRLVATGTRRTAELAEAEGLGTSGQLHHHLRQLVTAGWLRSAGRGLYEIPAPRVVPLLVVLTAAQR